MLSTENAPMHDTRGLAAPLKAWVLKDPELAANYGATGNMSSDTRVLKASNEILYCNHAKDFISRTFDSANLLSGPRIFTYDH